MSKGQDVSKQDKNKALMEELWARVEEERNSLKEACLSLARVARQWGHGFESPASLKGKDLRGWGPSTDFSPMVQWVRDTEHELFIAESKVAWTAEQIRKEEAGE